MRLLLAIGVLIALSVTASAAPVHRTKLPPRNVRAPHPPTASKGFAVPGWTDEQTRTWIDEATGPAD
jgi:hypothetical protein